MTAALPIASGVRWRVHLVFGGLVGLPFGLALAAWVSGTGSAGGVLISGVVLALTLASLAAWRLEVGDSGLRYRAPLGMLHHVRYDDIERAAFESSRGGASPRFARFRLTARNQPPFTVSLRAFPQPVVAALFAALRRHGVPVGLPAQWQAEFAARRSEQERRP